MNKNIKVMEVPGYGFITMFYNCRSEEPKSWEWGRKVFRTLEENNIEYKTTYPEDEHYECSVWVKKEDWEKATELLRSPKKFQLHITRKNLKSAYYEDYTRFTQFTLRDLDSDKVIQGTTADTEKEEFKYYFEHGCLNGITKSHRNYKLFLKDNKVKLGFDEIEIVRDTYFDSGNIH